MAVIPGDSKPTAESSMSIAQINALSGVSEQSLLQVKTNSLLPDFGRAGKSLFGAIGDLAGGILNVIGGVASAVLPSWVPHAVGQSADQVRDGQRDLLEKTELLSPLLDYISFSTKPGVDYRPGTGRVPFTYQLGPSRGFTDMGDGRIRLDDVGVYDMRCTITAAWMGVGTPNNIQAYLRVLKPSGGINDVFSEQGYWMTTYNEVTMTIVSSVVVEEPGHFVDAFTITNGNRAFWGGPKWNRLTVQHITRNTGNGDGSEDSSDPDDDPKPNDDQDESAGGQMVTANPELVARMAEMVNRPSATDNEEDDDA